jgi:hypothetical protein
MYIEGDSCDRGATSIRNTTMFPLSDTSQRTTDILSF